MTAKFLKNIETVLFVLKVFLSFMKLINADKITVVKILSSEDKFTVTSQIVYTVRQSRTLHCFNLFIGH